MIAKCRSFLAVVAAAFSLFVLLSPSSEALAGASVTGMQLVSSVRSGRTTFDYTYKIQVQNGTPGLTSAVATVQSLAPATVVLDGTVSLGTLLVNSTITSSDTFTIRQDRTFAFDPSKL